MPTFMSACMDFFGLKEGQGKMDFGREVIRLTEDDKQEIFEGFQKLGIVCDKPLPKS